MKKRGRERETKSAESVSLLFFGKMEFCGNYNMSMTRKFVIIGMVLFFELYPCFTLFWKALT